MPVAEAELGELVQQGNVAAFTALYDAYAPSVHDFLLRLVRDPAAAEDLTQTTFIKAFEHRFAIRDPAKVRSWLWAAAHNAAMNYLSRTRRSEPIEDQPDLATLAPGPEETAEAHDAAELVWLAAASLEPRQYSVLDLTVRRDLSTPEVAQALGVPVGHAAVLVSRAREALGNAVRYLLVARRRDQCPQLSVLVPAGVRSLTPEQRSTVDHHMRRCERCRELGDRLTAPAELLGAFVLLPLPAQLQKVDWSKQLAALSPQPSARSAGSSAGHQAMTALQLIVAAVAITAISVPQSGSAAAGPRRPVTFAATGSASPSASTSLRASPAPSSSGTAPGATSGAPSQTLIAVADPAVFVGDLRQTRFSTSPATVLLLRPDGSTANSLTLKPGVALIGAAGPRLFVLVPGGKLRGVRIDGTVEDLGNLGSKPLYGFIPSPDGSRWLWGTLDSGSMYFGPIQSYSDIPAPGSSSPTLQSSVHLAGVNLTERTVDGATYVNHVIQPWAWGAAGPVEGIALVCCGLGGGPSAFGIPYVAPAYLLDLDHGTTKPLPGPAGCGFIDVATDGTVVCEPRSSGGFRLIHPDGVAVTVPIPPWIYQAGATYFSPQPGRMSLAFVGQFSGLTGAFDRYETDIVNTVDGSVKQLPLIGVLPAFRARSPWLPDGSLLVTRSNGAPGGDPGTYVVSPSGQAVRLTASGVPVGLLDARSP